MLVFGLSSTIVLLLLATAFVAGLARGFSGFGTALIFVPVASALLGPKTAVPLLLVMDAIVAVGMIPGAWRIGNRAEVGLMSIGALLGVPLGAYVLAISDPIALRWAIVALVVGLLALLVSGWRYHGRPKLPLTVGVGAVAGLLSGAAQVGGPPVVAYWLGGAIPARTVRANIVLYFAVSTVLSMASYLAGGLIEYRVLLLTALTAPAYAVGLWLGARLFGFADEATFRRICFALIAGAAILGLPLWDSLRG